MRRFSTGDVGLMVGLEIHQQLDTGRKLFCGCGTAESGEYPVTFRRALRPSRGELGEHDPAALFEGSKGMTMEYYGNPESSCLVEQDEEPPHGLDGDAKGIALVIAAALKSSVFGEIYPMRKTVVDGSNTAGFQRTMLVSRGGFYEAGGRRIGIQSVCLEEDAAKILGDDGSVRKYSLERLGVPLVEIATEPFEAGPGEARAAALALGRILRATKMVRRGIGSIRQDVNVSIREGGTVVEVKGVQQLEQLEGVVEFEARRQYGMLQISSDLAGRKLERPGRIDATGEAGSWGSKVVMEALGRGHVVSLLVFEGLAGSFGREHVPGIRLGRDLAEVARSFGLGGIFHSDELPAYGITGGDADSLRERHGIGDGDAFVLLASPPGIADAVADRIFLRMSEIRDGGIPRDTRAATQSGETRFLRPRPGAARMYPETDVPPIAVSPWELEEAGRKVPKPWDESVRELRERFKINQQLAEQVFDSRYLGIFEEVAAGGSNPAFVASVLCSTITSLERDGLDPGLLGDGEIAKAFVLLEDEKIAKESVGIIFESIMAGRARTVEEAMAGASMEAVSEEDVEGMVGEIVVENMGLVRKQGERAMGPLMGIAMKRLRGKASGEAVSKALSKAIRERLG